MTRTVRPAAVAGRFYPAQAAALAAEVDAYLARVALQTGEAVPKLVIVPHAGYVYSGAVAAQAYARVAAWRSRVRRVVLLGPTHRVAVRGIAAPTAAAFDTPLGRVAVDHAALRRLADLPQVLAHDEAHALEHALEVQLPLLQRVLDDFSVVPLAVGQVGADAVAQVLDRLWGGDETLIVISSDLSHYLSYDDARASDHATVQQVLAFDATLRPAQACGATPVNAALAVARRRGLAPRLLHLCNSGDTAGNTPDGRRRVVGYAAIAFDARAGQAADDGRADDAALGPALLSRARNAIAQRLGQACVDEPAHAAMAEPGATFVTLHRAGALRGCIGRMQADRALEADVRANAAAAAFRDSRFAPLGRDEFAGLHIKVSVLEPAQPLGALGEADALARIEPGRDGLLLQWRGAHATFLPQVWAQLPAAADFLAALKRKAGLARDFWADDLRLSRYGVRSFDTQVET
jgi:MEMO1 family protein